MWKAVRTVVFKLSASPITSYHQRAINTELTPIVLKKGSRWNNNVLVIILFHFSCEGSRHIFNLHRNSNFSAQQDNKTQQRCHLGRTTPTWENDSSTAHFYVSVLFAGVQSLCPEHLNLFSVWCPQVKSGRICHVMSAQGCRIWKKNNKKKRKGAARWLIRLGRFCWMGPIVWYWIPTVPVLTVACVHTE